ncbi:PAS domain-containing protein [uncultured Deinococcus sp.]|uniref:PAS domain-containing sensor histidine kinase n=1 Tax=uncultured Deinococcus sp. TaxID=158789 RepID=UPI003748CF99
MSLVPGATPLSESGLSESEQSRLLDALSLPVWVADREGRLLYGNRAWQAAAGPEATPGTPFVQALHPDDRAGLLRLWGAEEYGAPPLQHTGRLRRADGSYATCRFEVQPLSRLPGEAPAWMGHAAELGAPLRETPPPTPTEAQRRLRELQERHHFSMQAASDVIWDCQLRSGHIVWNAALETLFGHPFTETTEAWWRGQVHPEDRARVEDSLRAIQDSNDATWEAEYRFRRADGQYADVLDRAFVLRDAGGLSVRMIGAMQDLTERKAAEARLRDQEAHLRLATRSADVGIWDYDPVWNVLRWDARTKALFGLAPDAAVTYQESFVLGLHPDDRAATEAAVALALAPDGPAAYDIEYRTIGHGDGVVRWVDARGRAFFDQGVAVRFIGTVLDITERKHTEEELRLLNAALEQRVQERTAELLRTNAELRRSNMELERFAYITSHDLQEPLRTVASFVNLLELRYGHLFDDRARLYIGMALKGTERMKVLVEDVLTFSRMSGSRPAAQAIRAGIPLQEALDRLGQRLTETGAQVSFGDLPTVRGDGPQLAQLFQNLIGNALKFVAPGTAPRVQVAATREDGMWHFTVADNGIGIEPEYLQHVFELFKRLHTRDHYEGTGLGLSICQKIVEQQGGQIWVESQLGRGSTFHFTLPAG